MLEFVTIIKNERKKLGISRRQFAITCGVSPSYLGEIERGEKKNPSVDTLEKIRKGLNHYSNKEKFKLFGEDKECYYERSKIDC
ncbi:helix-turn-helix domain-containing protein [Mammaliicoccus sciuri]|uniref:helix-turn-helix domain-containing protein n=1 Tax=Mammaliicoccus sciuri TaxID=1296 RepID=UPI003A92A929